MGKRQLGTTVIFVNPVGLGCMRFSHAYGTAVEKNLAVKTIRSAYDVGYNFFLILQNVISTSLSTA